MRLKSVLKTTAAAAAIVALLGIGAAIAAVNNPLNTSADVTIIGPITINEDTRLNFGKIVPPPTGDTDVTVTPAGAISQTGSGSLLGGHAAGSYDFTGEPSAAFDIAYSAFSCTGTGLTLQVIADNSTGTLNETNIGLGGTLRVNASASGDPGLKSCSFTMTASYL